MARRHRPLFPLPCPRRNRYAPSSSSQSPLSSVSAWRRKLRPLPCSSSPNRTRLRWAPVWLAASPPNTGECLQSPLSSVSAWRRKLRPLPCSSSPNRTRLRWAPVWLAASPPFGRKPFWFGKIKSWDHTGAQTRAGMGDAYSGKIRPSPARGSPRRRCPQ